MVTAILKPLAGPAIPRRVLGGVAILLVSASTLLMSSYSSAAIDADNTKNNQKDDLNPTPIDQSNDPIDIKIVAAIRSAITSDSSLSTNAQNIKIVVQKNIVTLRGPVESISEKSRIDHLAKNTQGVSRVENQLTVKN